MRDHSIQSGAARSRKRVVGVRELKTHAARIVRHVRDARASYVLTHRGQAVGLILPLESADAANQTVEHIDPEAAWNRFVSAGRRLERRFRPGVGGVGILASSRR